MSSQMSVSDFEQRRNKILELIVEAYVSTATPVGSEAIARKLRSSLSSATIRNVMGELEEAGFLEQPHTSAGRVPTERGYRFYVDSVMDARRMAPEELRQLESLVHPQEMDVDQLLERASQVLAQLAQQAGFVVASSLKQGAVKQVELVPLGVRKVLCVLVGSEDMIASHVIEIQEPLTREEASALTRFISTELEGLSFGDLLASLERRMLGGDDLLYRLVKRSLDILQLALSTEPNERLYLDGVSFMVSQPEFLRDPRKTHNMLRGLDAEELLAHRIRQDAAADRVRIRIGQEVQVDGLEECSYLAAPVAIDNEVIATVGVLGPKRMDYPRLHALVDGMRRCVASILSRWDQ